MATWKKSLFRGVVEEAVNGNSSVSMIARKLQTSTYAIECELYRWEQLTFSEKWFKWDKNLNRIKITLGPDFLEWFIKGVYQNDIRSGKKFDQYKKPSSIPKGVLTMDDISNDDRLSNYSELVNY